MPFMSAYAGTLFFLTFHRLKNTGISSFHLLKRGRLFTVSFPLFLLFYWPAALEISAAGIGGGSSAVGILLLISIIGLAFPSI